MAIHGVTVGRVEAVRRTWHSGLASSCPSFIYFFRLSFAHFHSSFLLSSVLNLSSFVPLIFLCSFASLLEAETESDGTRKRTGGEVKGKKRRMEGVASTVVTVSDTVYPALLPLMRTPRLPATD